MNKQRLTTILAFALRPSWWPEILRRFKVSVALKLLPPKSGSSSSAANKWCEQNAVSNEKFFKHLGIQYVESLSSNHAEFFKYAIDQEISDPFNLQQEKKTGTGASADLLYTISKSRKASTILETGVDRGWSSFAFLLALSETGGELTSIDTPKYKSKKGFARTGVVVHPALRNNWKLLLKPDYVALKDLQKSKEKRFDLIHYDSDKSYWGRLQSYIALFEVLDQGGVLISDDIADNTAFRDFCAEVECSPTVTWADGVGQSIGRYIAIVEK